LLQIWISAREPSCGLAVVELRMNSTCYRVNMFEHRPMSHHQAGRLSELGDQPQRSRHILIVAESSETVDRVRVERRNPPTGATVVFEHRQSKLFRITIASFVARSFPTRRRMRVGARPIISPSTLPAGLPRFGCARDRRQPPPRSCPAEWG
jgi:hypothetical protein